MFNVETRWQVNMYIQVVTVLHETTDEEMLMWLFSVEYVIVMGKVVISNDQCELFLVSCANCCKYFFQLICFLGNEMSNVSIYGTNMSLLNVWTRIEWWPIFSLFNGKCIYQRKSAIWNETIRKTQSTEFRLLSQTELSNKIFLTISVRCLISVDWGFCESFSYSG